LGGHFPGSGILFLDRGKFSGGVVLAGDTMHVEMDRRWVSFMYSYPNHIPLPSIKVREIASQMRPYKYKELFSAFIGKQIIRKADYRVQLSAKRYIHHLQN
ncbi:MAG TPA: hypothetical protein VE177_00910, partial [Candidatus Binatus sp.]|nr:hypothetical protein [Candidatus Binatus sp.]